MRWQPWPPLAVLLLYVAVSLSGCLSDGTGERASFSFQVANTSDFALTVLVLVRPETGAAAIIDRAYPMAEHTKTRIERFTSPDANLTVEASAGNLSAAKTIALPLGHQSLHVRVLNTRIDIQLAVQNP